MHDFQTKVLPTAARLTLGGVFVVFGVNAFLQFMPMPPMPDAAMAFMAALGATGYMIPLIKLVEIGAGLLLLSNRFVPLALALLTPGIVNIFLFHAFLAPGGAAIGVLLVVLGGYLAYDFRDVYRPMLSSRPLPTARKRPEQRFTHDHSLAGQ